MVLIFAAQYASKLSLIEIQEQWSLDDLLMYLAFFAQAKEQEAEALKKMTNKQ